MMNWTRWSTVLCRASLIRDSAGLANSMVGSIMSSAIKKHTKMTQQLSNSVEDTCSSTLSDSHESLLISDTEATIFAQPFASLFDAPIAIGRRVTLHRCMLIIARITSCMAPNWALPFYLYSLWCFIPATPLRRLYRVRSHDDLTISAADCSHFAQSLVSGRIDCRASEISRIVSETIARALEQVQEAEQQQQVTSCLNKAINESRKVLKCLAATPDCEADMFACQAMLCTISQALIQATSGDSSSTIEILLDLANVRQQRHHSLVGCC